MDKELQTVLNSGGIVTAYFGGTAPQKKVMLQEDIDAQLAPLVATSLTAAEHTKTQNLINIQDNSDEPTGFNLDDPTTMGIMEFCMSASGGSYWRIDENNVYSILVGQTTFGDGATALADKTFAIRPSASGKFSFWNKGKFIEKTALESLALSASGTKQIVTYGNDGVLKLSTDISDAITKDTIISLVYTSGTQKVIFANERHGKEMNGTTHLNLHDTVGANGRDGLDISGMANNGTTFTSISAGSFWDEDIQHSLAGVTTAPFAYRNTTGEWEYENDGTNVLATNDLAFTNGTAADALYNRNNGDGTFDLVDTGSDYVVMHIFATNDSEFPICKIVGQNLYATRGDARDHLPGDVARMEVGDLPTPELVHLYSYILDGNGAIETGTNGEIYIDYRFKFPISEF